MFADFCDMVSERLGDLLTKILVWFEVNGCLQCKCGKSSCLAHSYQRNHFVMGSCVEFSEDAVF